MFIETPRFFFNVNFWVLEIPLYAAKAKGSKNCCTLVFFEPGPIFHKEIVCDVSVRIDFVIDFNQGSKTYLEETK